MDKGNSWDPVTTRPVDLSSEDWMVSLGDAPPGICLSPPSDCWATSSGSLPLPGISRISLDSRIIWDCTWYLSSPDGSFRDCCGGKERSLPEGSFWRSNVSDSLREREDILLSWPGGTSRRSDLSDIFLIWSPCSCPEGSFLLGSESRWTDCIYCSCPAGSFLSFLRSIELDWPGTSRRKGISLGTSSFSSSWFGGDNSWSGWESVNSPVSKNVFLSFDANS